MVLHATHLMVDVLYIPMYGRACYTPNGIGVIYITSCTLVYYIILNTDNIVKYKYK